MSTFEATSSPTGIAPKVAQPRSPRPARGPRTLNIDRARSQVRVTFDDTSAALGAAVTTVDNVGKAKVAASVVTLDGGRAVSIRRAGGKALRLPSFQPGEARPRRAALLVSNTSTADELSPGTRPFSFGATVRLFRRHQGRLLVDNGSNLIQRGRYDDQALAR